MTLLSRQVLLGAAVLSAPALWQGFVTGSLSIDTAITRWAITAVLVWLALSALVAVVGKPEKRTTDADSEGTGPTWRTGSSRGGAGQAQSPDAATSASSTSGGMTSPAPPSS